MIPWQHLGTAPVPGEGGGELRLMRRGGEFSIMIGGNELMNSRLSGSEEALAAETLKRLENVGAPRLLIGGLGMGFTLRAALAAMPGQGRVQVAELVPEVVAWARNEMAPVFAGSLEDPRVLVEVGDVNAAIEGAREDFDAILLDVDNGPDGLTSQANGRLYDATGLQRARRALKPGGILAVWSSAPDARFTSRLLRAGFAVEELRVRADRQKRGARHVIWLATKPQPAAKASSKETSPAGTPSANASARKYSAGAPEYRRRGSREKPKRV